jgi:hypothetical protein
MNFQERKKKLLKECQDRQEITGIKLSRPDAVQTLGPGQMLYEILQNQQAILEILHELLLRSH